ncbi:MAG: peroxiredoxin family protein [Fluviicola sp.]|jgi:thiol-disulfide isomerase/thioredoxin
MKLLLFFSFLIISAFTNAQHLKVKVGKYDAFLHINKTTTLPVHFSIIEKNKERIAVISNAEERIELHAPLKFGDTIILPFPDFDSEIRVKISKKSTLNGYWINNNKGSNYKIPFSAKFVKTQVKQTKSTIDLNGKWETYFNPNGDKEAAITFLKQTGSHITGTVLTETGDYRFLEGEVENNKFYLTAFDGTHAFMLTGTENNGKIEGSFYSGKHYQTSYFSTRNETFELRNSDSITVVKKDENLFTFKLPTLDGKDYIFPNENTTNKVVIIQIMGTWCPNCLDETKYYESLYKKYHDKGLEIISIGYESAETFAEQAKKIETLKSRYNLDFTFLVGGKANKQLASQHFSMLNEIISFPTSIYIGKDGKVRRVHTGFSGPGTGDIYLEYVKKTDALIESLLAE